MLPRTLVLVPALTPGDWHLASALKHRRQVSGAWRPIRGEVQTVGTWAGRPLVPDAEIPRCGLNRLERDPILWG
jgi:hypothetical protein